MKVLMLGWELPPHHSGGLGVACYQMCRELSTSGVDIEFILPYTAKHDIDFMKVTPAHPQSVNAVKWAGGVYNSGDYTTGTVRLHDEQLDLNNQQDLFAYNVARLAYAKEFDVIHAHDWLTFKAGIAAKRATGKPLIVHVHATQYDQSAGGHGNPAVRDIEYQGLAMADKIFAVSEYTKQVIVREYGIPAEKIHVVHNSMDITDVSIDEDHNYHVYLEQMKSLGYTVVTNIGRKTIQKGLTHLLEAAALVVRKNPKVLFVLAGSGEQDDELLELAADYGISKNVISVGWVQGKQWRDTYRISDVFVMPSVSEPFGLTPLEAIGYGSAVIVSKQSGIAEVLRNIYAVDFWDVEQMADMILSLAEHPSLRNEMWQQSYNEFKSQSWKKSADLMHHHYKHIGAMA